MLTKIEDVLKSNPFISSKVSDRIKFYQYPNSSDLNIGPYIVIDPLSPPTPDDYADDKWLTNDYLFQIEVWSKNPMDKRDVADKIQEVMWNELGFHNSGSGVDQYDSDLNVHRDARRYRGKAYVDSL